MKHNTQAVVAELSTLLQTTRENLTKLEGFPQKSLQAHPSGGGWNALECLEHLNRYAAHYLPVLDKALAHAAGKAETEYKAGWLGEYFAKTMRAENARPGKMKSPKDKNPVGAPLNGQQVLGVFEADLHRTEALLSKSLRASWNRTRIQTSLSPLLRLNLGDTLRFYVYHVDRHVQQAMRAAEAAL